MLTRLRLTDGTSYAKCLIKLSREVPSASLEINVAFLGRTSVKVGVFRKRLSEAISEDFCICLNGPELQKKRAH